MQGLIEAEVFVLLDGLPKEHVDSFESVNVKAQLVSQEFFDGI